MNRQNLFSDSWDGENEEARTRHRVFWRPDDARMGATLYELAPNAPDLRTHMHFGAEEMFFVLSGRPVFRNQHGEEDPKTVMHGSRLAIPIPSSSREAATLASSPASRSRSSSRSAGSTVARAEEAARAASSLIAGLTDEGLKGCVFPDYWESGSQPSR